MGKLLFAAISCQLSAAAAAEAAAAAPAAAKRFLSSAPAPELLAALEAEVKSLNEVCHVKTESHCSWWTWCPSGSSCNDNNECECDAGYCTLDNSTCVSAASLHSPTPNTVSWPLSALVDALTQDAIDQFITHDEGKVGENCGDDFNLNMSSIWWPGCGGVESVEDFDKCTGSCIQKSTMQEIDDFNAQHPGMKVSYVSRAGAGEGGAALEQVDLTGWWLPAPGHSSSTPRIVVQHGHTSNSNKFRQQFVAFQLRKLGYSVLVNNLRDHCYSSDSEASIVEWGHAYPYDVLGAWDYLRTDPDGVLGGALDDGKVGILGFSMGALLTTTAFGIEGKVPAVWVDGPPLSPESAFRFGSFQHVRDSYLPNDWLAQLAIDIVAPPVWANVVAEALKQGVDITKYTPGKVLPQGPETQRKIMVTGNVHDTTVNFADGRELIKMLEEFPTKYQVSDSTFTELCNGQTHCVDHLAEADRYSAEMCKFWSDVFGENKDCAETTSCNTLTAGTCDPDWTKFSWCSWWRGETFCDDGACRCMEGHCTPDGEVCEKQ